MFYRAALVIMILVIGSQVALATKPDFDTPTPVLDHDFIQGGSATHTKSDSVVVYGGAGTLEGTFETAEGLPDLQGWTPIDNTVRPTEWKITDWQIADLDPDTPDNRVWWCGTVFNNPCAEGTGRSWDMSLEWFGTVADPADTVAVHLEAAFNIGIPDINYDYCQLQAMTAGGWLTIQTWGDVILAQSIDETFTLSPPDYSGQINDQVHIRFRFKSDGAWDDEDCVLDGLGGVQLDNITVKFDQGDGFVQIGEVETCQPGDPLQWATAAVPGGVGNFGQVWTGLEDIDPCVQNYSPQLAFIDDGLVVPGTGGYPCDTWCYGPGGYVVNPVGGLAGPDEHIDSWVVSPVIAWPGPEYDGLLVEFDVYRHLEFEPGIFYQWMARTAAAGEDIANTEWDNEGWVHYGDGDYFRFSTNASHLVVPDATQVQVALAVYEIGWVWGWVDNDASPSPYYDNVRVTAYQMEGPQLYVEEEDLAQDAFPPNGSLNYGDLGANSVRFDPPVRGVTNVQTPYLVEGDSLTVKMHGYSPAQLDFPPKLHYRLFPNPLFDAYRTNIPPGSNNTATEGSVECSPYLGFDEGPWSADLPDTGFFFPGDVIHYYFRAEDSAGGVGLVPADISGFGVNPLDRGLDERYDPMFTVRALPSMHGATPGDQPPILLWDDSGSDLELDAWLRGMTPLGQDVGVHYDVYRTQFPDEGFYNGLGSIASSSLIAGYETILYTAGEQGEFTLNPADGRLLGNDQGVLASWLYGDARLLVAMGDDFVSDLWNDSNLVSRDFVRTYLGVTWIADDVKLSIHAQEKFKVWPVVGVPVFDDSHWAVDGSCPGVNKFDHIEPMPGAAVSAEFAEPGGGPGPYTAAAAVTMPFFHATTTSQVVTLPYGLESFASPRVLAKSQFPDGPWPPGVVGFLADILSYQGHPVTSVDLPEHHSLSLAAYPNPFNPRTEIRYSLEKAGPVTVDLYDLRGRKVRSLVDEVRPAGGSVAVWDGRDDGGRGVSSGVYFCVMKAEGGTRKMKVTLLR